MKDYKKILEGVMNIINTTEISDIGFANICAYISENCPELAESADERIRKAIICGMTVHKNQGKETFAAIPINDCIAWLEKQGEHANFRNKIQIGDKVTRNEGGVLVNISQLNRVAKERKKQGGEQILANTAKTCKDEQKPNPYSGTSFEYNGHTWGMCARDNGVELLLDGELKAFLPLEKSFIDNVHPQPELAPKSALEAAKEEKVDNANKVEPKDYNDIDPHFGKPIDKVEPKFKVGDWIVNNKSKDVFFIKSINSGYCSLEDTKGNIYSPCLPFESDFHLWTIADAKDGDVLVAYESSLMEDGYIILFKELLPQNGGVSYCHYNYNCTNPHFEFNEDDNWLFDGESGVIHPATKEQRDILFAKMKEEGYVWDAKKKELNKIEQKSTIIPKFKVGDIIRHKEQGFTCKIIAIDTATAEYGVSEYNGTHLPFDFQDAWELVEQKSADKIEPFDKYEGLTDFEKTLADICMGWIGEEHGWKQYIKDNADVLLRIAVKMFNSVQDAPFEQEPAETVKWSLQEESCICQLESLVKEQWRQAERTHNSVNIKKMSELMFFLKTLNPNKKPQRIISAEAKEAMYNKSAWSEEDEERIKNILSVLDVQVCWDGATGEKKNPYQKEIDWLKSLKYKVQPKKEWSEEDKRSIRDSIFYLKSAKKYFEKDDDILWDEKWFNLCIEFLEALYKKLQPQSTWKPSGEHYELEEFAKIVRCNLTGISKSVQQLFEAKYLQLTGNKMYEGFKD